METSVKKALTDFICREYGEEAEAILSYIPSGPMDLDSIKTVMINEVVADMPENDFYSKQEQSYYMQTTLPLFQAAGVDVSSIQDILDMGIYITSIIKTPKDGTTVERSEIQHYVPILEKELELFPHLKAVMLMGDVAKKAVNMISKNETKRNAVPAVSTYKLRHSEIYYKDIRLFPAYIMTGKNLAIEKSKSTMSSEEIAKMLELIRG